METNMYSGGRLADGTVRVTVNETPLPMRLELVDYSPAGFGWGNDASGSAQLALAILAYEFGNVAACADLVRFRRDVIARLPRTARWAMDSIYLRRWRECETREAQQPNE